MPVPTPTWTWPTWTCNDVPGFRDSDGYDCHWYGLNGGVECILSGDSFPNPITGLTANQACELIILFFLQTLCFFCFLTYSCCYCGYFLTGCVCHRGNPPITPAPVPTPTPPPVTFSPALPCTDVPGFRDSDGYDCAWYAMYDALPCKLDGDSYPDPNTGLTANQVS